MFFCAKLFRFTGLCWHCLALCSAFAGVIDVPLWLITEIANLVLRPHKESLEISIKISLESSAKDEPMRKCSKNALGSRSNATISSKKAK